MSRFLPLTRGLLAIRDVLADQLGATAVQALAEAAVGAAWLAAGMLTFGIFIRREPAQRVTGVRHLDGCRSRDYAGA